MLMSWHDSEEKVNKDKFQERIVSIVRQCKSVIDVIDMKTASEKRINNYTDTRETRVSREDLKEKVLDRLCDVNS